MKTIYVTGDVAIDCHLFRTSTQSNSPLKWNDQSNADYCERWGGASLLGRLLKTAAQRQGGIEVETPLLTDQPIGNETDYLRSYALWEPHAMEVVNGKESGRKVWRVKEFFGMQPSSSAGKVVASTARKVGSIVVIDDANLESNQNGFCSNSEAWSENLQQSGDRDWIVWKLWRPQLDRPLGRYLIEKNSSRLVLVLSANGLREDGIYISRRVSWERTAQELYAALETKFRPYRKRTSAMTIIVSLGAAGAFVFHAGSNSGAPKARLIYDAKCMEEEWENDHPGRIVGYTSCLTAGVAIAVARSPETPNWESGVMYALSAMKGLLMEGFQEQKSTAGDAGCVGIDFPFDVVADRLAGGGNAGLQGAYVPNPYGELVAAVAQRSEEKIRTGGRWTILQSKHGNSLYDLARRIAINGPKKSLGDVPMVSYGKLDSADRREIESYRNIFNLFNEYELRVSNDRSSAKPVCIAVFGPPGSGKSFGVKQIAKGQLSNVEAVTFNLSQFSGPSDLIAALHRVRDIGLKGKLPLVFWDEFDTALNNADLGWLRYFLEPMQDGTFLEGQTVHPIGPAIFIFAGGTRASFASFNRLRGRDGYESFRAAKGPDFISRLKGYLDILGPNPIGDDPADDPTYVVRRAIVLRSVLQDHTELLKGGDKLDIDPGVLQAFLTVSVYKHGARSMESIVLSSALAGKRRFDPSALPQQDQLDLHVPAWEFMSLMHCTKMIWQERIEKLAEAFHDNYCSSLRKRKYEYAPTSDDAANKSHLLVDWGNLNPEDQEQNREAVRSIPDKLALSGQVMVPSDGQAVTLSSDVLERLAELEHERWLRSKIAGGWRYGPKRINPEKIHDAMLPWKAMTIEERAVRFPENPEAVGLTELPESQKDKDRDQVNGLLGVLEELGFTLVESALREANRHEAAIEKAKRLQAASTPPS